MKIRTSELSGAALDWAVCKAGGGKASTDRQGLCVWLDGHSLCGRFNYSTDWSQGGPIIEREGICLLDPCSNQNHNGQWHANCGAWGADGETALAAAMRSFVASKLGDEVDIPEELL